jgi:hypothetical protein
MQECLAVHSDFRQSHFGSQVIDVDLVIFHVVREPDFRAYDFVHDRAKIGRLPGSSHSIGAYHECASLTKITPSVPNLGSGRRTEACDGLPI